MAEYEKENCTMSHESHTKGGVRGKRGISGKGRSGKGKRERSGKKRKRKKRKKRKKRTARRDETEDHPMKSQEWDPGIPEQDEMPPVPPPSCSWP